MDALSQISLQAAAPSEPHNGLIKAASLSDNQGCGCSSPPSRQKTYERQGRTVHLRAV
jgi:hypothetical protein